MIFITEGQSAAGSITSCRNPELQAVFTLKGKPLNVWDLNRTIVYKNDEIFNLMRTLNVEEDCTESSLRKSDYSDRRRCGRVAHPQPPDHLLPAFFS